MRHLLVLPALLALACAACARPPVHALRLDRVVLYQNGIGHFERTGALVGDRLQLVLRPYEVDDVIKTLTVLDERGQAQQVAAVLPTPAATEGDRVVVEVVLTRPGAHLVVSYAVPTATWKTTYRVALPERPGQPVLLQAWAMVDNVSEESWEHVRLTLATGAPLTFATDLRSPHFVPRPDATGLLVTPSATAPVAAERARGGDTDRDGLADVEDRCPEEPETSNGLDDDDGCPDRGRVVVTDNQIVILDKVYFGAGAWTPAPAAGPLLDAVAATLRANPAITLVAIAGHAADGEADPWGLSARRAGAVRAALLARGVEQPLELRPFGDTLPAGATAEGNRRVELEVRRDQGPAPARGAAALAASTRARAVVDEVAGATRYQLADRVTVPRGTSTLVSVLSRSIPGEDVFLFRPDPGVPGSELHPLRAARLAVPAGLGLEPGPVAVFADGSFAGEALMQRTPGGETSYLPYAVDGGTVVRIATTGDERPQRLVAITRGVAVVENATIMRTTYTIEAGARPAARIFLRHVPADGFTVQALPPGTERGDEALLVPVPLAAGKTSTLVIEERRPVERRLTILDRDGTSLGLYLEGANLPAAVRARVDDIVAARTALARVETELEGLREALAEVSERAGDLEQSLATVAKLPGADAADLRRRLIASLAAIAARTDALSKQLAAAGARRIETRVRVQTALEGLSLAEPAAVVVAP